MAIGAASKVIGDERSKSIAEGAEAVEKKPIAEGELKEAEQGVLDQQFSRAKSEAALHKAEAAIEKYGPASMTPNEKRFDAANERAAKAMSEIDAANQALSELEGKIKARTEMIARYEKAIKKGQSWGGNY